MSFMSWLTGRDEKESDVYANYEKVELVVENIKSVGTNEVENAREAVHEAMNQLNNVNGLSQYVGTVNVGNFDVIFDEIASGIEQIGSQIQAKANDIKAYEESEWYEKLGSTFAMGAAKFGEGILSVAEDIGDGVVSVVGWAAPEDSGLEKACASFVEKEWSHDAFNFYYESDFAKSSAFTEDSAIAGGFKIAGSTAGYLGLGGVASGFGGSLAANSTGKIAKATGTFMKSTTKVNTLTAGLSGMGSGTEANLHKGLSMNEAAREGAKQGASQAAVAYGFGKLGERGQKKQAVKEAQKNVDEARKAVQKAEDALKSSADEMVNPNNTRGMQDMAKNAYEQAQDDLVAAKQNLANSKQSLTNAQNSKLSDFQGYSDAITKKGQKFGEKLYDVGSKGTKYLSDTAAASMALRSKAPDAGLKTQAATNSKEAFKQSIGIDKNSITGGVKTVKEGLKNTYKNTQLGFQTAMANPGQTARNALTAAKNATTTAWNSAPAVIKGVVTNPATPGVVGATLNASGREIVEANGNNDKAQTQFRRNFEGSLEPDKVINEPNGSVDEVNIQDSGDSSIPVNDYPNDNNYPPSGNTSYPGNSSGGGSSQTNPTNTSTDTPEPSTPENNNPGTGDTGNNPTPDPGNNDPTPNPGNNDNNNGNDSSTGDSNNGGGSTIVTPPSDNGGGGSTIIGGGGNSQHSGGGFTGSGGFTPGTGTNTDTPVLEETSPIEDATTSIDDVIKGNKYTKIPTSTKPITTTSTSGGGSAVIPVVAGLSAAAAAGIGAKVYMDRKKNNDTGEEEEIDTEEWSGEDQIELDYADDIQETENYLDDDDDYGYQAEETEKYGARTSEELADLQ